MHPATGKWCLSSLVLFLVLTISFPAWPQRQTENIHGRDAAPREVLVRFRSLKPSTLTQLARAHDLDLVTRIGAAPQLYRLRARGKKASLLLDELANLAEVAYVEPNYIVNAVELPNDPRFAELWALSNTGQAFGFPAGTAGADIKALAAWELSIGSREAVIAVVDTGIDYTHADLAANMWSAPSEFSVTIAGQTITCPAGSHGFNAITLSCDPKDDHYHGTHVAGTIGAVGQNSLGVVGVNWVTKIIAAKFLDSTGSGTTADAINAFEFLVQTKQFFGATRGAEIRLVSNSWGGGGFSQALLDEIQSADDMLFVFAAGNNGTNNDVQPFYPAAYTSSNLLAVAATDNTDTLANFSNYGASTVHLAAPGVNILSTSPGQSYRYLSGTSMATPHVSGTAMLVLSHCNLGTEDLKAVILDNVDPLSALRNMTVSGGRLNADRAIRACSAYGSVPVTVSPRIFSFENIVVGESSTTRTVTVTNQQLTAAANILDISTQGDFLESTACGRQLAPAAQCSVQLRFTPLATGNRVGTLTVATDAAANPLTVSLSGTGTAQVSVSPASLSFASLEVGRSSSASSVLITNNRTSGPVIVSGIFTTGDFAQTNSCGSSIPVGGSCSVSVTFSPTAAGARTGSLTVTDDAFGSPQLVPLSGTGKPPLPDLIVTSVSATVQPDGSVSVTDFVKNAGAAAATASTTQYYLSTSPWMKDATARLLNGGRLIPAVPVGATSSGTVIAQLPAAAPAGSYYVWACADDLQQIAESSETNNCASMTRAIGVGPDLVVTSVAATVQADGSISVTDTVKNAGTTASTDSTVRYYLSTSAWMKDATASLLTGSRAVTGLNLGATSSGSSTVQVPATVPAGSYYLWACADDLQQVAESAETNNCAALTRAVGVGPDMVVTSVTATVQADGSISVSDTVKNAGTAAAAGSTMQYYLSTSAWTKDATARLLTGNRAVMALAAGATSSGVATVLVPATVPSGSYYVWACADDLQQVAESSEANNCSAMTRAVGVGPDLVVTSMTATVQADGSLSVTDTVKNSGTISAAATVTQYYLSTSPWTKDSAARMLSGNRAVTPLANGATSSGTATVLVPTSVPAGSYYVWACADDLQQVTESSETNNCAAMTRAVGVGPDLLVTSVAAAVQAHGTISVTDAVKNSGTTGAPASTTQYYLSTSAWTKDSTARLLNGTRAVTALGMGATSSGTAIVQVPTTVPAGNYYVWACADDLRQVLESIETNNCAAMTRAVGVGPDLVVTSVTATLQANGAVSVTDTIKNAGSAPAANSTTQYYLSTSAWTKDAAARLLNGTRPVSGLAAGDSSTATALLQLPATVPAGTYYVWSCADDLQNVTESSETNNCAATRSAVIVH